MERIERFKRFSFNILNNFFFKQDTSVWGTMQTVTELKLVFLYPFFPKKERKTISVQQEIIFYLNSESQETNYCIHATLFLIAYRHVQPEGDAER